MDAVTLGLAQADARRRYAPLVTLAAAVGDGTTDDTAKIQAALTAVSTFARTATVRGVAGKTYLISAPLVIKSNTRLDMTGCVINNSYSNAGNMVNNAAMTAQRTLTDVVTTATNTTITSAAATFSSADIGRSIFIAGVGGGSGSLHCTTITAVASATSATVALAPLITSAAATAVLYTRDTNIEIVGGTWNWGSHANPGSPTTTQLHNIVLRHVDGVRISGLTCTSVLGNGKYAISLGDLTKFIVNDITFSTSSDGVHIAGPAQYGSIENLFGYTGDDLVGITAMDYPAYLDTLGNVSDIDVRKLYAKGGLAAFKITGGYAGYATVRRVLCDGVYGNTQIRPVAIQDDKTVTDVGEVTVRNVYCQPADGSSLVNLTVSAGKLLRFENLHWEGASAQSNAQIFFVGGGTNSAGAATTPSIAQLSIDGLHVTGAPGTMYGLYLAGGTIADLTMNGFYADTSSSVVTALYLGGGGIIGQARLRNVNVSRGGGNLINLAGNATLYRLYIGDGYCTGGGVLLLTTGGTTPVTEVEIVNWSHTAAYLITAGSPMLVNLANVNANTATAIVRTVGAAATPVRVKLANVIPKTATAVALIRDGSQAVSIVGSAAQVDVSILTPSDGDEAYNSNAALGCGTGRVLYNTTAAKWKNLYSGLTN